MQGAKVKSRQEKKYSGKVQILGNILCTSAYSNEVFRLRFFPPLQRMPVKRQSGQTTKCKVLLRVSWKHKASTLVSVRACWNFGHSGFLAQYPSRPLLKGTIKGIQEICKSLLACFIFTLSLDIIQSLTFTFKTHTNFSCRIFPYIDYWL